MNKKTIDTPKGSLNCPVHHRRLFVKKYFSLKKENFEFIDAQGLYCIDCNAIYVHTNNIPYKQGYIKNQELKLINCRKQVLSHWQSDQSSSLPFHYIKCEKRLDNRSFCNCGSELMLVALEMPEDDYNSAFISGLLCQKCEILYTEINSFLLEDGYLFFNQPYIFEDSVYLSDNTLKDDISFRKKFNMLNIKSIDTLGDEEIILFYKKKLFINRKLAPVDSVVITNEGIYINEKVIIDEIPIVKHSGFKQVRLILDLSEVANVQNIESMTEKQYIYFKKMKKNIEPVEILKIDKISILLSKVGVYHKSTHKLYLYDVDYDRYKKMIYKNQDLKRTNDRLFSKEYTNYDYVQEMKNKDTIYELQLIRSSNNHVTKHHQYQEKIVNFGYFENGVLYRIKMLVYYCEDCDITFDFYESFLSQMASAKIKLNNLILTFTDENYDPIIFPQMELREYSMLKLFGYSVGYTGQTERKRHEILRFILDNKIMDSAEIKNYIEYFIRYNGKRNNMDLARIEWKSDIKFINDYIKNKRV